MNLQIIKEKKHKNGDVTCEFGYDKEFKELVKKIYNKKRFSHKLAKRLVIEALHNMMVKDKMKELNKRLDDALKLNGLRRKLK